jgi:hypothetical protein
LKCCYSINFNIFRLSEHRKPNYRSLFFNEFCDRCSHFKHVTVLCLLYLKWKPISRKWRKILLSVSAILFSSAKITSEVN